MSLHTREKTYKLWLVSKIDHREFFSHIGSEFCQVHSAYILERSLTIVNSAQKLFSSSEPKAPRCAYCIPMTPVSVVSLSINVLKIFTSETAEPIALKFHMETP